MAIIRYEPYSLLNQLQREVNRVFHRGWHGSEEPGVSAADWSPAVDIKEEANHYLIHADVPGVKPENIDITVEKNVLTLKGHRDTIKQSEDKDYKRVERSYGSFFRRFDLPEAIETEGIVAKTKDGVLEVTVPKGEKARARKISVTG